MNRFQPYSRRELIRRRSSWTRRNVRVVSFIIAGTLGLLAFLTLIIAATWPAHVSKGYALGLMHAGLVAGCLHLLNSGFLAHDGEAIWHVRGAWGEENTRSEHRAKRKRLIWGWVDSINLQSGDIDHLIVTRNGGIIALDSKWRNKTNVNDTIDMARAAQRARSRAEALARTVLKSEHGARHRARTNPLSVRPAVVLWGAVQHSVPRDAHIDGVSFVAGRQLVPWLRALDGQQVSKQAASDILERLKNFRATSWQDA